MSLLTIAILVPTLYSVFAAGLNLMPTIEQYPLPPQLGEAMVTVFGYVASWSEVFTPIVTLFYLALAGLGLEVGMFLWRTIRWIIGLIRGARV